MRLIIETISTIIVAKFFVCPPFDGLAARDTKFDIGFHTFYFNDGHAKIMDR
jgi:hypothetical protein